MLLNMRKRSQSCLRNAMRSLLPRRGTASQAENLRLQPQF